MIVTDAKVMIFALLFIISSLPEKNSAETDLMVLFQNWKQCRKRHSITPKATENENFRYWPTEEKYL